mmetsp:Transcript_42701/g.142098  ORF Transcript_42701/g.142098 Transcript_42701/m.142098 type:complete len:709 (-) Transcript_42701:423-2549(-)
MRRHQGELEDLRVHHHRALGLLEQRRHLLHLGWPAHAARVHGEAASVRLAREVGPPRRHLAERGQHRPAALGDAHDRGEDRVELALRRRVAQPAEQLAAQDVQRLVHLVLGDAPGVVAGRPVPHVEQLFVPLVARREERDGAGDALGERLRQLGRGERAQHEQQVGVADAEVAHVLIQHLLVLALERLVELAGQLVVPAEQQRTQLAEQRLAQPAPRRREGLPRLRVEGEAAEGLAADRVVLAGVVQQQEGDVVVEAGGEADDVQDDGRGARLEGAGVEVRRLVRQPQDALHERLGRAAELMEEQVVRRAEQLGRGGGHVLRLELGRPGGQVGARLEEHRVEQRLQLRHLQQVDAVLRRKEGDDERDAQVGHRQVREQQLGVVLAERLCRRVLDVLVAKVGQLPHVQQVVLALDSGRSRVLVGVGARREAVERRHLAAAHARLGGEQLRRAAGGVAAHVKVLLVEVERELGLPLRVRRFRRETFQLWVEEQLEVEADVAEAAKLWVVLDEQVVNVADVLRHVADVGGESEVLGNGAHPSDGPDLERVGRLPAVHLRQRGLGGKVVERASARCVELRGVHGHRSRLPRELGRADGVPGAVVRAAQADAHARGLVDGDLAHDHVGDGGNARGDRHPNPVERARVVDREGGGGEMLADALQKQHQVELLRVQHRGAPQASALGEDGADALALQPRDVLAAERGAEQRLLAA